MIVADQHAFARVLTANHVTRNRMRNDARICKGKIFGQNAAPSIGAESESKSWELSIREALTRQTGRIGWPE